MLLPYCRQFSFFAYTKLIITERLAALRCSVTHRRCCESKSSGSISDVFMCFVLFSSRELCRGLGIFTQDLMMLIWLKANKLLLLLQVWREKNVLKPAPGKRKCNCKNKVSHRQIAHGMYQQYTQQVCQECPNVKFEREGLSINVDIEKGMRDGQEIVFYEDGEPIIDGEPGDLKFVVRTKPHNRFKREGNHLHTTVTITLLDALVGFQKDIKHLDGHQVAVGSTKITKPKEVRKFSGEGMPVFESSKKGDLFVMFEVVFPSSLTEAQKAAIKQILGS